MKVTFLGVGEACDEWLPNTSIWLQTESGQQRSSVLLDCGFTAPSLYWQKSSDPEDLDALWVSHFHGDHYFGIPALLTRFWEMKRQKPFVIAGQQGVEDTVLKAMDLAYPSLRERFAYGLGFAPVEPGKPERIAGLSWTCARNGHSQRDLAVRIDDGKSSVFYSGDGRPTAETLELARGCDLIIHEAFRLEGEVPGHGTIPACIELARKAGAGSLALVHIQRDERRERKREIREAIAQVKDLRVLLPEPGDEIDL